MAVEEAAAGAGGRSGRRDPAGALTRNSSGPNGSRRKDCARASSGLSVAPVRPPPDHSGVEGGAGGTGGGDTAARRVISAPATLAADPAPLDASLAAAGLVSSGGAPAGAGAGPGNAERWNRTRRPEGVRKTVSEPGTAEPPPAPAAGSPTGGSMPADSFCELRSVVWPSAEVG